MIPIEKSDKFLNAVFPRDFDQIQEVYKGETGSVFIARYKSEGIMYALKERRIGDCSKKELTNEIRLLGQLNHPNIVKFYGFIYDATKTSLFMVLEYCEESDLHRLITARAKTKLYFQEQTIWIILYDICLGVKHLHEFGICHRDLKPLNILCTRNGGMWRFKVGDLGVSRQLHKQTQFMHTMIGTPLYISPEVVENKPYTEKADLWSLGVILYELSTLRPPFMARNLLQLAKVIVAGEYDPPPVCYSPELSWCVSWLMNPDALKRPTISDVLVFVAERLQPGVYLSADLNVSTDKAGLTAGSMKKRGERGGSSSEPESKSGGEAAVATSTVKMKQQHASHTTGSGMVVAVGYEVDAYSAPTPCAPADDELRVSVSSARLQTLLRRETLRLSRLLQERTLRTGYNSGAYGCSTSAAYAVSPGPSSSRSTHRSGTDREVQRNVELAAKAVGDDEENRGDPGDPIAIAERRVNIISEVLRAGDRAEGKERDVRDQQVLMVTAEFAKMFGLREVPPGAESLAAAEADEKHASDYDDRHHVVALSGAVRAAGNKHGRDGGGGDTSLREGNAVLQYPSSSRIIDGGRRPEAYEAFGTSWGHSTGVRRHGGGSHSATADGHAIFKPVAIGTGSSASGSVSEGLQPLRVVDAKGGVASALAASNEAKFSTPARQPPPPTRSPLW